MQIYTNLKKRLCFNANLNAKKAMQIEVWLQALVDDKNCIIQPLKFH